MFGGATMNALQSSVLKAYSLPVEYQNALSKIIDQFVNVVQDKPKKKSVIMGIADGKYDIPYDIDSCNDEIAEMFGMVD